MVDANGLWCRWGRAVDVHGCHELPDVPISRLLSSVTVKHRKSWLFGALVSASLGVSEPALAGTCTTDASGNIDCSGSFTSNISNNAKLQPGVTVTSPG